MSWPPRASVGYRPNPLARALRGAPTMLLGAIVRDITDPFFAGAIEAVSAEARALGYNIVLGHAHAEATEAHALAAMLEARQCDAILLLGDMGDQPRLLDDLRDTHVPVVALWQGSEFDLIPGVSVDNRSGIATAVAHLGRPRAIAGSRSSAVGCSVTSASARTPTRRRWPACSATSRPATSSTWRTLRVTARPPFAR